MLNNFTKQDTLFCKGIALCLLLFHHLFYLHPEYVFFHKFSYLASTCVAIFLILSGYGLMTSASSGFSLKGFLTKRFSKLYTTYWLIWLFFVPLGFFIHKFNLHSIYGTHIIQKLLLNFMGLQIFFNFYGINATWWFMSLIIALYLLFPLLKNLVLKFNHYFLIFVFLVTLLFRNVGYNGTTPVSFNFLILWIFPFVLGMYCAKNNAFIKTKEVLSTHKLVKFILYLSIMLLLVYIKVSAKLIMSIDGLIGFFVIMTSYEYFSVFSAVKKSMMVIGEHSFNIFLFHTFIYYYYFGHFIYSFKNPVLIFAVLLSICLTLSILLNFFKSALSKLITLFYDRIFVDDKREKQNA